VDAAARAALEEEVFGKHVLITSHDDWPVPEVVAGPGPTETTPVQDKLAQALSLARYASRR
jgi:hypothetical protein